MTRRTLNTAHPDGKRNLSDDERLQNARNRINFAILQNLDSRLALDETTRRTEDWFHRQIAWRGNLKAAEIYEDMTWIVRNEHATTDDVVVKAICDTVWDRYQAIRDAITHKVDLELEIEGLRR